MEMHYVYCEAETKIYVLFQLISYFKSHSSYTRDFLCVGL